MQGHVAWEEFTLLILKQYEEHYNIRLDINTGALTTEVYVFLHDIIMKQKTRLLQLSTDFCHNQLLFG